MTNEIIQKQEFLSTLTGRKVNISPKTVNFTVILTLAEYQDISEQLGQHESINCYIITTYDNGNEVSRNFYTEQDIQVLREEHKDLECLENIDFLHEVYHEYTKTFNLSPSFSHDVTFGKYVIIDGESVNITN